MNKITYPALLLFTLFSCTEEFQAPQKKDQPATRQTTKASNCVYWYVVSSEKSDNGTITSQKFVHSSCTEYNTPVELTSPNTEDAGNLISAGGPTFPATPSVNDKYEYTSPESDYVRYTYTADRGWRVVERIIPMSLIQKYPDMYVFLNVPSLSDGLTVFGLDDLYYTYEAGLDQWHGEVK